MRSFIAIDLPEEAKQELAELQKQLPEAKKKIVEKQNLHLTLKFLGELSDFKISKCKEELKKISFEKFEAKLGKIGFFSPSFIRVVFVSIEPEEKIKEMHSIIDNALAKAGMKKDERFESHATIARIKFVKDKQGFIKSLQELQVKPINFTVDSFSLKKSILSREGLVYEDILKFSLL